MTQPLAHRTARRLARAAGVLAGMAIGATLLDRPALATIAACLTIAVTLTLVLHHVRQPKGNR